MHPVSPRPDASPAGPHTTLHRHVPSTSSCEPHSTSADVLLLDLSDTEDDHSPDTQVPAKLAVDSYDSEWNVPSPDLKLVFDLTAVPSDLWRSPAPPTVLVAESQAYALLHQGYATFDDIEALLDSAGPSTCQTPKATVRGGPPSPMLILSGRLYLLVQHRHSAQHHVVPSCGTGADIYSAGSLSRYTVFLAHDISRYSAMCRFACTLTSTMSGTWRVLLCPAVAGRVVAFGSNTMAEPMHWTITQLRAQ